MFRQYFLSCFTIQKMFEEYGAEKPWEETSPQTPFCLGSWAPWFLSSPGGCVCPLMVPVKLLMSLTQAEIQGFIFSLLCFCNMQEETLPSWAPKTLLFWGCLLLPVPPLWLPSMLLVFKYSAISFCIQGWAGILHQDFLITVQVSEEIFV